MDDLEDIRKQLAEIKERLDEIAPIEKSVEESEPGELVISFIIVLVGLGIAILFILIGPKLLPL